MKREDFIGFSWIIFIYVYMFLVSNFVSNMLYQKILGFLGIALLFLGLIGQEMYLKMRYAGYKLLKGYIPGFKQEFQFLIDEIDEIKKEGKSMTKLHLVRPFNHPRYGDINTVIINTKKEFFDTLDFIPQENALWIYGMNLDHPSVAYAVLKETKVITDHATPVPVFDLVFTDKVFDKETRTKEAVNKNLKEEIEKLKRLYEQEHQNVIRLEEENAGLRNEVQALLQAKMDFNKQVVEGILAYREAYGDLLTAAKHLSGRFTGIPLKEIVSLIGVIGVLVFLWKNPEFVMWFFEHPIQTAIVLLAIAAVGYAVYNKKK